MTSASPQLKLVKTARNHSRLRPKRSTFFDFNQEETNNPKSYAESTVNNKNVQPPQTARFQRIKNNFSDIQSSVRLQPSFMNTDSYTSDIFQFISNKQAYKVQEVQKKQKKKNRVPRRRHSHYQIKTPFQAEEQTKTQELIQSNHLIHKSNNFMFEENSNKKQANPELFQYSPSQNWVNHQENKNKQEQCMINASQSKLFLENDDLLFFCDEQNVTKRDLNPQQIQSQATEHSQMQQNILFPSSKMKEIQRQIENHILNINRCITRTSFLFNPLPIQSRLVFEACVTNTALNRQYSFWLVGEDSKILLMTAKKYMSLTQDEYKIMQYQEQENNQITFAANLSTDFKRKQFVLDDQILENNSRKIFASFNINQIQGRQSSITAYFQQQCKPLLLSNKSNQLLLKRLLSQKTVKLNYMSSFNLDQKIQQKVMKDYSLIQTKKTLAMKNSQDNIKLYIGKLHSKRYKILVGSGLTPIIAFATSIVLIQS